MSKNSLVVLNPNSELVEASGVTALMQRIRPHWKGKHLVQRVERLLTTDPSSACQRIFNASIHDLREKIIVAGIDLASEAARQHKLPPITKAEDVEEYSVLRLIDLAYRMGILSRPEYKRVLRAYDIRKDLEHEDDEYEAGIEDCVYIFATCIDVVLSKDPLHLIKLTDVKQIIEQPTAAALNDSLLEEYKHAPQARQDEIFKFLVSTALNKRQPDIVQQNSFNALFSLRPHTHAAVLIDRSKELVEQIGKTAPELRVARVALAAGLFPYLRKSQIKELFSGYLEKMKQVGYQWRKHAEHGELLRTLQELGGLEHVPDDLLPDYLEWLCLCYVGESGGYGAGYNRKVFYSNIGAPLAWDILRDADRPLSKQIESLRTTTRLKVTLSDEYVSRRFEAIVDEVQ
ncbi:hypothetical protein DF047_23005 [Burkholderia cenocepacia]|uniref:hypothetical protein n=1 Tax=Burkholderia cenocepacia TaxID=95486 RepID=UPI000F5BD124|nr:hypothetical protein [Burkholderia cenocepacia]RQV04762.1 hypothetical protein DF047_23005 [Burkholderia cenocepacia]